MADTNPGRIEQQMALDLMPFVRGKSWYSDFCSALETLLEEYTKAGQQALTKRDYVEASRSVAKAYRTWDWKIAICGRTSHHRVTTRRKSSSKR